MKTYKIYILFFALIAVSSAKCTAQNMQEYTIPLSNPGQPGKLYAKVRKGSIKVTGYSGKDVIISVAPYMDDNDGGSSKNGLRRIPNTSSPFEIIEEDNEVRIRGTENSSINFEIKVPRKFSMQINTHHDGYIEVSDVVWEIEVDGHHESIFLNNVGGSVIADTHHGMIKVIFSSITPNKPMAFSTYHGDIDISFPSNINASTKVKTTKGNIYTDFDIALVAESSTVESTSSKGTRIEVGGWLKGDIGSGGSEFLFSTYHGDVILRKN